MTTQENSTRPENPKNSEKMESLKGKQPVNNSKPQTGVIDTEELCNQIVNDLIAKLSTEILKSLHNKLETMETTIVSNQQENQKFVSKKDFQIFTQNNNSFLRQIQKISENKIRFPDLKTKSKAIIYSFALCIALSAFGAGILAQEYITLYDPTKGWKNYIWEKHGSNIQKCKNTAQQRQTDINCNVNENPFNRRE